MAEPPPDDPTATLDDLRPVAERTAAPVVLAERYELGRLLGEGGMGEVHDCSDRLLERQVALKTIRRDRRSQLLSTRLFREACVQAQLEHPSIVPVYEVARDELGREFFTMRKLSGRSLEEIIQSKRRRRDSGGSTVEPDSHNRHQLLTAFTQVCQAVHYAHSRGVLHRDLKPSNIMLGDFGEVYVLDWGLAKIRPEETAADSSVVVDGVRQVTVAGAALGTPGYMAPEQLGDGEIDARADVFALGAVLFEILTLEPLLDADAVRARLRREPARWDARASLAAPDVPPELDHICVRATALLPSGRHVSVRALHDEVEAFLDGERDDALRERLAADHVARAGEVRLDDPDEALREINRALALAPNEPRALELLVDLLESPSATEKARAEVETAGLARHQGAQTLVLFFTIPWLVVYSIVLYVRGIQDLVLAMLPLAAWSAASLATLIAQRRRVSSAVWYPTASFMLAVAVSTVVTGPILLIPSFVTAALTVHVLVQPRWLRPLTLSLGALAVLVPNALVWLHLYTPYTFPDDATFVLHSVTKRMNGPNLGVILTMVDAVLVFGVSMFSTGFRREIDRLREAKAFMAWQLSMLVSPAPVSEPTTLPTPAGPAPEPAVAPRADAIEAADPSLALEGERYVRLERLADDGETGLERVHDRRIGRQVALKRPHGEGAPGICREAVFQAALEHPAIPSVYDVGADDRGPWFTMKLVRGRRLSEVIGAATTAPIRQQYLRSVAKLCLAIEYAHARGVLHGALHPSNVVLGDFGELHVLGWRRGQRRDEDGGFVAPEQRAGGRIDERTDVYALGALLRAVGSDASAPAPLDRALAELCARACAHEPENRFPSARALHDALDALLSSDRDEELRSQLAAERLGKATRRTDRALATGSLPARVDALRELGRALALATDRSEALGLLTRLLETRPDEMPASVSRALEEQNWRASVKLGPRSALVYLIAFVVGFPLHGLIAGTRSPGHVVLVSTSWAIAALIVWRQSRTGGLAAFPWGAIATYVALLTTALAIGPWFVVPSVTVIVTMAYVLVTQPRWQYPIIAGGTVTVLGSGLPVLIGASKAVAIHGTVEPVFTCQGAFYTSSLTFIAVLPIVNFLCVIAGAFYATRYRDLVDALEAENRARVLALSRLVEHGAGGR